MIILEIRVQCLGLLGRVATRDYGLLAFGRSGSIGVLTWALVSIEGFRMFCFIPKSCE